jgi:multidrug efflux pump subunit AcrB
MACTAAISARIPQLVFGPYTPFPAEFRIMGPAPANLSEIPQKALEIMQSVPDVRQTNQDWRNRAPALRFVPDQQRLNWVGLSPAEAAQQLPFLITGISVAYFGEPDFRVIPRVTFSIMLKCRSKRHPGILARPPITSNSGFERARR